MAHSKSFFFRKALKQCLNIHWFLSTVLGLMYSTSEAQNSITLVQNIPTAICPGQKLDIFFSQTVTANGGNIYSVQLSNAAGSFTAPVIIGTLTATTPSKIEATIPTNTSNGSGYRIRLVGSNPALTSNTNSANVTIGGGDCCRSPIQWQLSLGSSGGDASRKSIQTTDGGYLTIGWVSSNSGDVTGFKGGSYDAWVVKLDAQRNIVWKKTYGGSGNDFFYSVVEVADGFVFTGSSTSSSGDVVSNKGDYDTWVVKTDFSGNVTWKQSLGSTGTDEFFGVVAINDGYVFVGECSAGNGDVDGSQTRRDKVDIWVIKLNLSGNVVWKKCYGGSLDERGRAISKTLDNGFFIAGTTASTDGDVAGNHGSSDIWVLKLNSNGNLVWSKCIGGTSGDVGSGIATAPDGSPIITGESISNDGDFLGQNTGSYDIVALKLNAASGELMWRNMFGGAGIDDQGLGVSITADENILIGGRTASGDSHINNPKGDSDAWIIQLNSFGTIQWQKTLGGGNGETLYSITSTTDNGYLISCQSSSFDKNVGQNKGNGDFWIVKLAPDPIYITSPSQVVCSGGSSTLTLQGCAGTIGWNTGAKSSIINVSPTITTTYSATCTVNGCSSTAVFNVQVGNSLPFKIQDYTYGGNEDDRLAKVIRTSNGDYLLCGVSNTSGNGDKISNNDGIWLVRLNSSYQKIGETLITPPGIASETTLEIFQIKVNNFGIIHILYKWYLTSDSRERYYLASVIPSGEVIQITLSDNDAGEKLIFNDFTILKDNSIVLVGERNYESNSKRVRRKLLQKRKANTLEEEWRWDSYDEIERYFSKVIQLANGKLLIVGNKVDIADNPFCILTEADNNMESPAKMVYRDINVGVPNRITALANSSDGGFIVGLFTTANQGGDKTENSRGAHDYWVIKFNEGAVKEWDKTLGGTTGDLLSDIASLPDGSYLLTGSSESTASFDKSEPNKGSFDYWAVKIDNKGNKLWDKTLGGTGTDNSLSITLLENGKFIIWGYSNSPAGNDRSISKGSTDYWGVAISEPLKIFTFTSKTSICKGEKSNLTASNCIGTVIWSNGGVGESIDVSPTFTTSYTASCKVSGQVSCPSDPITITVCQSGSQSTFGYTSGNFSATDGGAAVYGISIVMPSGSAGVKPELGIAYNSQGGNGILGVGWSLDGLHAINRASKTRAQDEAFDVTRNSSIGINLNKEDRFALNGSRLVLAPNFIEQSEVLNGNYGRKGTEYFTEQNQFIKVSIPDTLSNGAPKYFLAYTKDGLIMEFGNTLDSRIDANDANATPITWLVNKISDRNGNYIKYIYQKEVSGVKGTTFPYGKINTYPIRIEYTTNDAVPFSAYNKIEFEYTPRTDKQWNFMKGVYVGGGDKLISKIKVFGNNKEVRRYEMTYTKSKFTANSLLFQIRECADTLCHEPTTFDWINEDKLRQDLTYQEYNSKSGPFPADAYTDVNKIRLFGDWDGDGTTDMFVINKITADYNYYLNRYPDSIPDGNNNFDEFPRTIFSLPLKVEFRTADFNADGKTDILWWSSLTGDAYIIYSGYWDGKLHFSYQHCGSFIPTNSNNPASLRTAFFQDREIELADWNHDGITDLVSIRKSNKYYTKDTDIWLQTQPPTYTANPNIGQVVMNRQSITVPNPVGSQAFNRWQIADFNNDGLSDVCVSDTATGYISIYKMLSVKTANKVLDADSSKYRIQDPTYSVSFLNTPKRFNWSPAQNKFIPFDGQPTNFYGRSFFAVDANGDGLPDIALKTSDVTYQFQLSTGDFDFFEDVYTITPAEVPLGDDITADLTDFNNDGNLDLLTYSRTTGYASSAVKLSGFDKSTISFRTPLSNSLLNDLAINFFFGNYSKSYLNELLFYKVNGSTLTNKVYNNNLEKSDLIGTINEGSGQEIQINYKTLKDPTVYARSGIAFRYPLYEFIAPISVLASVRSKDGIGGYVYTDYQYEGAFSHSVGRGFRGFTKVVTKDRQRNTYNIKYFNIDAHKWWLAGQPYKTEMRKDDPVNGQLLSLYEATFEAIPYSRSTSFAAQPSYMKSRSYYTYGKVSVARTYDLNTTNQINITTSRVTQDPYGNSTKVVVEHGDGVRDSTMSQYTDNIGSWLLGRLTRSTAFRFSPGKPSSVRTVAFEYNAVTGQLNKEISDPDSSVQIKRETLFTHDGAGNIIQTEVKAWNGTQVESRISQFQFDNQKRLRLNSTNPLGHQSSATYNTATASIATATDINGLVDTFEHDAFQRISKVISPTGEESIEKFYRAGTTYNSPANAKFVMYKKSGNSPAVIEHYDILGRMIKMDKVNFSGNTISYVISFNNKGEKTAETGPGVNTVYQYDLMSRVTRVTDFGTNDTYEYIGNQVTVTDIKGRKRIVEKNNQGQLLNSRWQSSNGSIANHQVNYEYDGRNNPTRVVGNNNGFEIKNYYDARGYKTKMEDPVMGTYRYEYNGFGEMLKQTDPKSNIVTMEYDKLGRVTKRTEPEGITTYVYDVGNKAKGKLTSMSGVDNVEYAYSYDNYGRTASETKTINSTNYVTSYLYTSDSKLDRITYPSGLVVKHEYNAQDYLYIVRRVSDGKVLWRAKTANAVDNILTEDVYEKGAGQNAVLRHSYTYSADLAHITQYQTFLPTDAGTPRLQRGLTYDNRYFITAQSETVYSGVGQVMRTGSTSYTYDDLDQLTAVTPNLSFPQTGQAENTAVTMSYDIYGNILSKSDVGNYVYNQNALGGPRYLTRVDVVNPAVCIPSFKISTEYTSFNKANDSSYALIYYGPDHARVIQKLFVNNKLTKTKIYVNGLYEVEVVGSQIRETSYIRGGSGVVAAETKVGTARTWQLWVKDHANNLVAVVDTNGTILEHLRYDVWGRRLKANAAGAMADSVSHLTDRGFTKHEHLDLFQLINMNGRIYDPVIARFISPDPFIQDALDLQAYNRYAYVQNNPIMLIDPSGYKSFWRKAKEAVSNIVNTVAEKASKVIQYAAYPQLREYYIKARFVAKVLDSKVMPSIVRDNWRAPITTAAAIAVGTITAPLGPVASGAAAGFTSGFLGSAFNGGSYSDAVNAGTKGAIYGAISGTLTAGVAGATNGIENEVLRSGAKAVGHGIVQGTMAEVQGGDFWQGAAAGAVSGAASSNIDRIMPGDVSFGATTTRVGIAAILGGTSAVLSGGKFANGAMAGAFERMYNGEPDFIDKLLKGAEVVRDAVIDEVVSKFTEKGIIEGAKTRGANVSLRPYVNSLKYLRWVGTVTTIIDALDPILIDPNGTMDKPDYTKQLNSRDLAPEANTDALPIPILH